MKKGKIIIIGAACCLFLPIIFVLLGGGAFFGFANSATEHEEPLVEAIVLGNPPTAIAGFVPQRVTLLRGTQPSIDGSNSYDPDGGKIVSYKWSVKRAPETKRSLIGSVLSDGENPIWDMWQLTEEDLGEWVFELTVTGERGAQASDELVVVVQDRVDAISEPVKVSAGEVTFLEADDPVVGITIGGESVAYPAKITYQHGLVNDSVGGTPIFVVFCEFCQSGVAWKRILDGQVFMMRTFGGTLFEDRYLVEDDVTGSTWHAVFGEVPEGALTGTTLEEVPAQLTTWGAWRVEHPETLVLSG